MKKTIKTIGRAAACWALAASAAFALSDPPPAGWRPFADDSPWNTPIPAGAPVEKNSERFIGKMLAISRGTQITINIRQWSIPVFWVDLSETPRYDVQAIEPYVFNALADPDRDGVARGVPIAPWARADPMQDKHMCVADWERGLEYDFLQMEYHGPGDWRARAVDFWELGGEGVHPPGVSSARGSGFPLLAGLILPHEIKHGEINHALALATPNNLPDLYVPPASTTDGYADTPYVLPEGARLQLDPALDVTTLGLSRAGLIIARALQKYGAYVCDNSGGFAFYAQNGDVWAGLLQNGDAAKIPIAKLRVLRLPELIIQPHTPWVKRAAGD